MLRCPDLFPPHWITNCPKSYFRGDGVLCSAPGCVSMFILWFLDVSQGTDVFLGFWPFGNALCKAVVSIDYYNMFTSTFTLTVMSMDRYVAVCHPVKALDMRTPHKAKVKKKRKLSFQSEICTFSKPFTPPLFSLKWPLASDKTSTISSAHFRRCQVMKCGCRQAGKH